MALPEAEQVQNEQRVLARWDRRQQALRGPKVSRVLRGIPLALWGALYVCVGLPMVCVGLIGCLSGWSPLSFGPDSSSAPWWAIALEGLVPLSLGCLVLFGMVVLTSERERRLAWKLCLWLGIAGTALLAGGVIPSLVVLFIVLGRGYLPWDLAILILFVVHEVAEVVPSGRCDGFWPQFVLPLLASSLTARQ